MEGNFTLADIQAMNHKSLLDSLIVAAQSAEAARIVGKLPETIAKHEANTHYMIMVLVSRLPSRNASWVKTLVKAARDLAVAIKTEGNSPKAVELKKFISDMTAKLLDRMKKFSEKSVSKGEKS